MKQQENPPRIDTALENGETAPLEHFEVGKMPPPTPEEQKEIEALSEAVKQKTPKDTVIQTTSQEEGRVISLPTKEQKKPWFKRLAVAASFLAATFAGSAQQTKSTERIASKDPEAKTKIVSKGNPKVGMLTFFTKSNTPEGRITKTEKSSLFQDNKFGITEDDVYTFAVDRGYNLIAGDGTDPKENNILFQKQFYADLKKNFPEIYEKIFSEKEGYGMPNANKDVDGFIGARIAEGVYYVNKILQGESSVEITYKPQEEPEKDSIPEMIDSIPEKIIPPPNLEDFDNNVIFFDLSYSMNDDKNALATKLDSLNLNKKIQLVGFTDKTVENKTVNSAEEAAAYLKRINLENYSTGEEIKETSIDEMIKFLSEKDFNPTEKTCFRTYTDEAFYTDNKKLNKLDSLAKEKNVVVQFVMRTGIGNSKVYKIFDLKKLLDVYKKVYEPRVMNRIAGPDREIQRLTKRMGELTIQAQNSTGKEKKQLEEEIKKLQELLVAQTKILNERQEVIITGEEIASAK